MTIENALKVAYDKRPTGGMQKQLLRIALKTLADYIVAQRTAQKENPR